MRTFLKQLFCRHSFQYIQWSIRWGYTFICLKCDKTKFVSPRKIHQTPLIISALILLTTTVAFSADITQKWDPVTGATGYKLYQSADAGATWAAPIDCGAATQWTLTVPDDRLYLWKVSAYNADGEGVAHWRGTWFDGRKKPLNPASALGITQP